MKKIWHPYQAWEDYKFGMWSKAPTTEEARLLRLAIEFTGNAELYGQYMMRVVQEWKYACEHNLTDRSLNRQAWVGHAACALAHGLPEYIVRRAWGMLTDQQRYDANAEASKAIKFWENLHVGTDHDAQQSFEF